MNGNYLLDTNVIIAILNGEVNLSKKLRKAQKIYVSSIALGELYFGMYNSARKKDNIKLLESFIDEVSVLNTTIETSKEYGIIKTELKKKGTPIPENDIWIGAIAAQHALTLVTKDKHFLSIKCISVELLV